MRTAERDLRPYLERLKELPFVQNARLIAPNPLGDRRLDAQILLETPSGGVELAAELKRTTLTRELAQTLVHLGTRVPRLLVLAPAIGPELGDLFAREGIDFVDLAGNCHVHVDDRYLARIQGRRLAAHPVAERALRGPAFRVVFALLAEPELARATTRALAAAAGGVSPQTARDARAKLAEDGILLATRTGMRWAAGGWKRALELFLVGFPALGSGLTMGRYRARERAPEALERELEPRFGALGEWRWGGGAAAARLDGHYRGDRTIVYFRDEAPIDDRQLPLVPDPNGNVVLMRAPGPLALEGPHPACAHPLLVYADLLAEGNDRAREGA
ncbi:MAG: hypothetical protein H5U40_07025, partial [Polyangiaceae bacterium]|nr:hypothetical protein [Polyangiaceae bacterium]